MVGGACPGSRRLTPLCRQPTQSCSVFLAVLLLFAGVAFLSTYIPARRAAMLDPTAVFREA
jgi:ABC-type lipoprotein release transport system permease subunit